jgi:spore coat protein A
MPPPDPAPFLDPLPLPPERVGPDGTRYYHVVMRNGRRKIHKDLDPTPFWGYEGLYPDPSIETPADCQVVVERPEPSPAIGCRSLS